MNLENNHISITSQNTIREICGPLFKATDITYFIFARFYDNGDHISFPSNSAWHQHFWKMGYLKKFTFYFKDKASSLIKQGDKQENRLFINNINSSIKIPNDYLFNEIGTRLRIRHFSFPIASLSEREMQSLLLTLRGRTASEIGFLLNISAKTVESYLESVRHKLNCKTRSELFDMAYTLEIIDLLKEYDFHIENKNV